MTLSIKQYQVICVSLLNLAGFVMQAIGASVLIANNADNHAVIVCSVIVSFVWIVGFSVYAWRHADIPKYPVVGIAAMAWPSYFAVSFMFVYVAGYVFA